MQKPDSGNSNKSTLKMCFIIIYFLSYVFEHIQTILIFQLGYTIGIPD